MVAIQPLKGELLKSTYDVNWKKKCLIIKR